MIYCELGFGCRVVPEFEMVGAWDNDEKEGRKPKLTIAHMPQCREGWKVSRLKPRPRTEVRGMKKE